MNKGINKPTPYEYEYDVRVIFFLLVCTSA